MKYLIEILILFAIVLLIVICSCFVVVLTNKALEHFSGSSFKNYDFKETEKILNSIDRPDYTKLISTLIDKKE